MPDPKTRSFRIPARFGFRRTARASGFIRGDSRRQASGTAMVELLLALPLVLIVGLGCLQYGLLMMVRAQAEYAVLESARAAAVDGGRRAPALEGLARGLAPTLAASTGDSDRSSLVLEARRRVAAGERSGWLRLVRQAPTEASFSDWSVPAFDDDGVPLGGEPVIPNDSLSYRSLTQQPRSGIRGILEGEPIGALSGTTLIDANLLKLELGYAVPLSVPLIGRLMVRILMLIDQCPNTVPQAPTVGLRGFAGDEPSAARPGRSLAWDCRAYLAPDDAGRPVPRWPLRVAAVVSMQTPAQAFESPRSLNAAPSTP